jgi:hypothetical protein
MNRNTPAAMSYEHIRRLIDMYSCSRRELLLMNEVGIIVEKRSTNASFPSLSQLCTEAMNILDFSVFSTQPPRTPRRASRVLRRRVSPRTTGMYARHTCFAGWKSVFVRAALGWGADYRTGRARFDLRHRPSTTAWKSACITPQVRLRTLGAKFSNATVGQGVGKGKFKLRRT